MESRIILPNHTVKYEEFPELLFGKSEDGLIYFNASQYIISKGDIKVHNIKNFKASFHFWIEAVSTIYELKPEILFVRDYHTGHIFIEESMTFPFISYIDNYFIIHIIERMHELFFNGFTLSDTLLLLLTKDRFDYEVLKKIEENKDEKKQI